MGWVSVDVDDTVVVKRKLEGSRLFDYMSPSRCQRRLFQPAACTITPLQE
jgi:hypothetical protein